MNTSVSKPGIGRGIKVIRVLLISNFALLVALIGPGSSRKLYFTQKRLGIAHLVTHSLQFWVVASTIVATVLFVGALVSKSQRPTKLDWALFLGWFSIAAIVCLLAFMVGMGG